MQETWFSVSCDSELISGIHHVVNDARIVVLIVVGGPQYRVGSHRQFVLLSRALQRSGIASIRADYRGMGDSSGELKGFEGIHDDLRCIVEFARTCYPGAEDIVMYGLCDGASAIAMSMHQLTDVTGVVLVNPWAQTSEIENPQAKLKHYYLRRLFDLSFWRGLIVGRVNFADAALGLWKTTRSAASSPSSPDSPFLERMKEGFDQFQGRMMIILSGDDLTARIFEEQFGYLWTSGERTCLKRLDEADHTFSDRSHLDNSCELVIRWLTGRNQCR